jgi:hypothetical protein
MSGLKETPLARAYRLMHARGVTTTTLAEAIGTSRAYVSRVLTGHERYGRTWERVRALLTPDEVALLDSMALPPKPERTWTPKNCRPGHVGYPGEQGEREASFTRNEPPRESPRPVPDKTPEAHSPADFPDGRRSADPTVRSFTTWRTRHAV